MAPDTAPNNPDHVPVDIVPTEVKDEAVTPDANVVPDRLAAGNDPAVTVPTVVIEADPAIGEYVVPAAVVVKYVFVSTESNPVAEVLTNPAVGSAPRVMVEVDFQYICCMTRRLKV